MQNRKAVIALLIVTGLVWGMIVYRIIKTVKGNDTIAIPDSYIPAAAPHAYTSDTFTLINDYRDPFLGNVPAPKPVYSSVPVSAPKVKAPPSPPPAPVDPFPAVNYLGRVQNQDSKKKVVIMMIKNGMKNMAEGEVYNNVTLLRVMGDSVLVSYGKEKKTIIKSGKKQPATK